MFPELALNFYNEMSSPSYLRVNGNNVVMNLIVRFDDDAQEKVGDVLKTENLYQKELEENKNIIKRLGKSCTLKDLAIDGITTRWSGVYKGSEYDFYKGMKVKFCVKITEDKKKYGRYIEVNLKSGVCGVSHMDGVNWKSNCNRKITMYNSYCSKHKNKKSGKCKGYESSLYSFVYYEGVVAHEFGHVMGLRDMYAEASCNHRYEPEKNAEIEYEEGGFGVPSGKGIMLQDGSAVSNDIEMILYTFKENQGQYYVPYGRLQKFSKAIKSNPAYKKDQKTYRWNSKTFKMVEVKD